VGGIPPLGLIIYEVRNTLGGIHAYVLPVRPDELSAAGVRQQQDNLFYVSPFIEMAMRHHFRVSPPGDHVNCASWRPTTRVPCSRQLSAAAAAP
jgi:DUF1365 family protein